MKLLVLSDLHFEFYEYLDDRASGVQKFIDELPSSDDVDVCILAGDIDSHRNLEDTIKRFCNKYEDVIFVHGNHEYYTSSLPKMLELTNNIQCENLHFLNRNVVEIKNQRFIGATLWFPKTEYSVKYKYYLNDFNHTKDFENWVYEENKKDVNFLTQEMKEEDVVITHHLPSKMCVHKQYKHSPFNCYFLCDIERLIIDKQPRLCINGHTHSSFDFWIKNTRMVCNPFGYLNQEENPNFKKDFIVEI